MLACVLFFPRRRKMRKNADEKTIDLRPCFFFFLSSGKEKSERNGGQVFFFSFLFSLSVNLDLSSSASATTQRGQSVKICSLFSAEQ